MSGGAEIPNAANEKLVALVSGFISDVTREACAMNIPDPRLVTAEVYSMATQSLFINANVHGHDMRQVLAGIGAGIGTVLAAVPEDRSLDALAALVNAMARSEAAARFGGA